MYYHILKTEVVLSYEDAVFNIHKGSEVYDSVIELIKNDKLEDIRSLVDIRLYIESESDNKFYIHNGVVYSYGKKVEDYISNKIVYFYLNELPFDNLLNFWNKLVDIESERSINELYLFLEHNKYPLTDDGCFIAYKKVTDNFKDYRTNTIDNSIGTIVEMNKDDVCADREITCSTGLHASSYEYANGFYSGEGIIIQVKIDPRDVVSVPYDHNNAKLRCCKYIVVSAFGHKLEEDFHEVVKIGNYKYLIENISLDKIELKSKNDIDFRKRKASAIPKSLMEIRKYFIDTLYTENYNSSIIYYGIYKNESDSIKCFTFNRVEN